jgi:cell division protein FtsZ
MIEVESQKRNPGIQIKVVGVGGGGGNALNTMEEAGIEGVTFVAANTDAQALERNRAPIKLQLGERLTKGLGAGADPEIGRAAALEDHDAIVDVLRGADMVFVTAGMGGGTGTGAAPIIAQAARDLGALCVGVVTKPFPFEMKKRMKQALLGIEEMRKAVDALIVIPNGRLFDVVTETTSLVEAFRKVDQVLLNAVQSVTDLILVPGLINVDFADARRVLENQGMALMGLGRAAGSNRAVDAAQMAVTSPLLEGVTVDGARKILINFTGGESLTLAEVNEANRIIEDRADEDAEVIFGVALDSALQDEVKVTIIATGFDGRDALTTDPAREEIPRPREVVAPPHSAPPPPPPRPVWKADREGARRSEPFLGNLPGDESELDIPTFLRRRAD